MSGRIFISYRRSDSQYATDRIYDRLSAYFGADRVFMDIDDIPLGVNFRTYIDQQVSTSEIVLAVIGDHWLSSLDSDGNNRLDNPGDFVRLELEAALKQGIKLVPLFIGDVQAVPAHRLPESLRELPMLNATRIRRGTDFDGDIDKLTRGIERIFAQQEAQRQRNTAALEELKESTAGIVGQLSGFEALLIQEMRKRTQLEKQALGIEKRIKELMREPGKQLRADVSSLRQQVETLRDEITELSFQIEERKQANQISLAQKQTEEQHIAIEKTESEQIANEMAAAERIAKEKVQADRIARENAETERLAQEKAEARRLANKKAEAERLKKRQEEAFKRKAAIADFRAKLGKVPIWAWGTGLAVILLGVAGLVFGPNLIEQLSANPSASTAEPTRTSQKITGPQAPAGFLEWSEAISRSTPDYIEDFSVYSYTWQREISPGFIMADYVTDAGELVITDDPDKIQNYEIPISYGVDFQLQLEFSPRIFTSGTPLIIDFMQNNEGGGGSFRLNRDGSWDIWVDTGEKEEKLDAGEMAPLSSDESYTLRLIDKEGHIAVLVNGELLSFVENPNHGEGNILIYFQAYKAFEVVYDNILLWDLSDDEYLVDPLDDQAYAFFAPVRQYLADTLPTFEEEFEDYQPYWDEMQVDFSEAKPVSLSQSVREGALQLNAIEGEDNGNFRLFFPQISARAFALQFDFNFMDPMASGSILTAAVQTTWENSEVQEGYSPYCDFYPRDEQLGCGLYLVGDSDFTEIASVGLPYQNIYSPHTLLVIFYYDQFTAFLDGYFLGYADGLEFFDQQISINVGTDEHLRKFDARVDNIKFWNLEGVVYQPWDEKGETQLMQFPILEHLVSVEPTFQDDFGAHQAYWNGMPVYQDDQQETSLAESVSNGAVHLDSRPEEMTHPFWDLTFSQLQQSADFALKFDVNLVEADRINAFISSASPEGYIFGMGVSDGSLGIELHRESGEGEKEPEVLISNGISFDKQTATVLLVSYQSKFFVFIDEYFIGYAAGVDVAENPEIVIIVPTDEDVTIVELDNIQYWNLDGVELNMQDEGSTPENNFDIERTLATIKDELSPTFEDDFSQADMVWGGTSEGLAIWSLVENGELVITDHAEEVDLGTDHGVPGLRFPTNGLFDAANFYLEFDINQNKSSVNEVGLFFRQSGNQEGGYQFVVVPGGGWIIREDGEEKYGAFSSSNGVDHVALLVKDDYFVVWLNDMPVVYEDQSLSYSGNLNQVWVSGENGDQAVFDNVRFWNLDGVEIE